MLRKGISIFVAPVISMSCASQKYHSVLQRVSSQPRLDRIGQPIPGRISTHPGNGTLLGAARQDDQRISKSRFDATDIVRVAAFDRTLLQLDFGSIASSAEALGPAAASRAQRSTARAADLANAGPRCGCVAAIASAHGFGHLGRFARAYQARFGELPSETLYRGSVGRTC